MVPEGMCEGHMFKAKAMLYSFLSRLAIKFDRSQSVEQSNNEIMGATPFIDDQAPISPSEAMPWERE